MTIVARKVTTQQRRLRAKTASALEWSFSNEAGLRTDIDGTSALPALGDIRARKRLHERSVLDGG